MTKQQRARWFRDKVKTLVRHPKISAEAKLLWLVLESFASMDGTSCHPKVETLMKHTGKCKRWVEKYLRELEQKHKLIRTAKMKTPFGWCNSYTVFYPVTLLAAERGVGTQKGPRGRDTKGPTTGYQSIGPTPTPSVDDEPPEKSVIVPFRAARTA